MQSWLASLFNIIYWILIFFALAFTFLFCFNLSKVDSFERNVTPIVQMMSNPADRTGTNAECLNRIDKINKSYSYTNNSGGKSYMYSVDPKGYQCEPKGSSASTKESTWNMSVDYGTPIAYRIKEQIPFLYLGNGITLSGLGTYTHNILVTTSCQANTDSQTNSHNNIPQ